MMLEDKIKKRIDEEEAISFHDFMEMALYYPGMGYYTSPGEKTGSGGDYYTSPELDNVFGVMLGKQLEEMWRLLKEPCFTIVEYGAGNGILCYDILDYLEKNKELYHGLTYHIIEKSPWMIAREKMILGRFAGKVKWNDSISEIGDITGCVLSNEVVDNFSVHKVVMQDELMEIFVGYNGQFTEVQRPAGEGLRDYLERFHITLPKNFRTEINLQAEDWIREIAAVLKKGFVLTIDYGYPAGELYHAKRSSGTIICYHCHTINDDPFSYIGKQDITAHVNFSSLLHTGRAAGLYYTGFTNQSYFMRSLGLTGHLRGTEKKDSPGTNKVDKVSAIAALMNMGQKFNILVQQKGLEPSPLSGMQFSSWLT